MFDPNRSAALVTHSPLDNGPITEILPGHEAKARFIEWDGQERQPGHCLELIQWPDEFVTHPEYPNELISVDDYEDTFYEPYCENGVPGGSVDISDAELEEDIPF